MNNYDWLTSDKKKKISSSKAPVHLVLPDNELITCNNYTGDGYFDGYDLFSIVSQLNLGLNSTSLGKALVFGKIFVFSEQLFLCSDEDADSETVNEVRSHIPSGAQLEFFSSDLEIIEISGKEKSIKNFIKDKTLVAKRLNEYLPYEYPLKFASNPKTSYSELEPSKFCGK